MRSLMIVTVLLAVSACNRGGGTNNAAGSSVNGAAANSAVPAANAAASSPAPAAAPAAAAGLPAGFPGADLAERGGECVAYLGLSRQANARPGGYDDPIMEQAQNMWRDALRIEVGMSDDEAQQLIGSSVNPLMATPAPQRDAASAWCVQNAPEVDPEG